VHQLVKKFDNYQDAARYVREKENKMEFSDQLGKNPRIQFTYFITCNWCLEREMSCSVLRDDEDVLRLRNLRFIALDLLMSHNSVIIIKEVTNSKRTVKSSGLLCLVYW
jgi:hypothetical protein